MIDTNIRMDMTHPLVSIVMPTYNRSEMLKEAVKTCLDQTYTNIELIIIDDGSVDNTSYLVESLRSQDNRIRYYRQPGNTGQCRSLNRGFTLCKGEYISWTSDDNRYKPQAIKEMVDILLQHNGVSVVYADYENTSIDGKIIRQRSLPDTFTKNDHIILGPCFLYKRNVYEEIGDYNLKLECAPDLDYWIRVYNRFNCFHICKSLYQNTVHSGSVTSKRSTKMFIESASIILGYTKGIRKKINIIRIWYWLAVKNEEKLGNIQGVIKYGLIVLIVHPQRFCELAKAFYSISPSSLKRVYRFFKSLF